jgi:hypothetical protein
LAAAERHLDWHLLSAAWSFEKALDTPRSHLKTAFWSAWFGSVACESQKTTSNSASTTASVETRLFGSLVRTLASVVQFPECALFGSPLASP